MPSFENSGYFELTSQSRFATRPFSFIPSDTAMSHELVVILPYLEVHFTVFLPVLPSRSIFLGNSHKLEGIGIEKSILRAVRIVLFGPL
ncbi:hypothetical protein D3C86_1400570 [compost metagenome]